MDTVRFGRALGFGTRQAVKTLLTAVDAATAENPSSKRTEPGAGQAPAANAPVTGTAGNARLASVPDPGRRAGQTVANTAVQARGVQKGLQRGSRKFGEAAWRPFVRLSGVLWLEVSGVFFGVFALLALGYLWKLRGAWYADAASRRSLMGAVAMLLLFGYFCVSSFVRARRRERQQ
jgi:hypothetical protein